jgi:zinc D-Ala-D-Ala dipeptidase
VAESGDDAAERKRCWTEQMEAAYRFMLAVQEQPLRECGERLAPLPAAVETAGVTVRFSPLPHAGGLPRMFLLRAGIVPDFISAAREMNDRGWAIRVEDAYRSTEMQRQLALKPDVFRAVLARVRWELDGRAPTVDLFRRRLAAIIAMNPRVGTHCSGSAIDISVTTLDASAEVDRGAPYLEVSELTLMESPFVSPEAAANRREITELMARHGFRTYSYEFWHYSKGDVYDALNAGAGLPARYGPVDVDAATGAVHPVSDPTAPLNSDAEIGRLIREAMAADEAHDAEAGSA